MHVVTI